MHIAHTSQIQIPTRQRKHFEPHSIETLAESIAEKGLLHPLVCKAQAGQFVLVAGERRLRAIKSLQSEGVIFTCNDILIDVGKVPVILISADLTDIQVREAELEENILREDLTWQEQAKALEELHNIRVAQNPKQTAISTAQEAFHLPADYTGGSASAKVMQAQTVAKHLDDPEVAAARNLNEAFNIASRKIEQDFVAELTRRGAAKPSAHNLWQGKLEEVLPNLSTKFDCIIADPPYGMGATESFGDAAKVAHRYEDTQEAALDVCSAIFELGYAATFDRAHLYMFCDIDLFSVLHDLGKLSGWDVWRTPLIWSKGSTGHAPIRNRGFRRTYEIILFASKGGREFGTLHNDVIQVPNLRDRIHAAQKPHELYRALLGYSCIPGDKVLDPCCGSGTIFPAAHELKLVATGIELDEEYYRMALTTLEATK